MTATTNAIASRAMLASINISVWEARKQDKALTREINTAHNAAEDAARVHKSLIARTAFAKIDAVAREARRWHYLRTLPWADSGTRLLSNEGFSVWADKVAELGARFDVAADEFDAAYPALYSQARIDLNGMFNEDDYPNPSDIRRRFSFARKIWAMPTAGDFRIDLANGESDRIRAEIQTEIDATMRAANRDIAERIAKVVGTMAETLVAYAPAPSGKREEAKGIFRNSLVTNVKDLAELLPSLNMTGNAKIAEITARLATLGAADPDQLKDSDNIRASTASAAKAILDDVSEFFA